jgi:hypothetical protein
MLHKSGLIERSGMWAFCDRIAGPNFLKDIGGQYGSDSIRADGIVRPTP